MVMARSSAIPAMIAKPVIAVSLIAAAIAGPCAPALAQRLDFSGQKITLAIATPPGGSIIKVASGEEVAARVNRIYGNPKPIIDEATVLLRSIPD
jgi:hypothetical protein